MRRPLEPSLTLILVTTLLAAYGPYVWSWVGGPLASLAIWGLDHVARKPSEAAPAHATTQRVAVIPAEPSRLG